MLGERADTRRISIHAPPRGATHGGGVLLVSLEMISIHAPPRGATKRHSTSWKRSLFQFTPLREGRRAPRSHATPPTNFNSRPSARGDPRRNAPKSFRPPFQFTPLREGRLLGTMAMARGCLISIHAPPRGATGYGLLYSWQEIFQFTPLREGRRLKVSPPKRVNIFQFTPLREGRRVHGQKGRTRRAISIHAPPRGATLCQNRYVLPGHISIHAPPRGATRTGCHSRKRRGRFQFTPLREGRPDGNAQGESLCAISIHAPPRGATSLPHHVGLAGHISIHAPPRGATSGALLFLYRPPISIHAPPRGATKSPSQFGTATNFNSRPSARGDVLRRGQPGRCTFQFTPLREGRRLAADMASFYNLISIHAPPRGATKKSVAVRNGNKFQFTPLREGRRVAAGATGTVYISIHAPPRGATSGGGYGVVLQPHFNSRPSARGDCMSNVYDTIYSTISIHAPPRGATSVS